MRTAGLGAAGTGPALHSRRPLLLLLPAVAEGAPAAAEGAPTAADLLLT